MNEPICKGFWNMCACNRCRAADRELEKASPEERKKASEDAQRQILSRVARGTVG